jgi:hypothetical protein
MLQPGFLELIVFAAAMAAALSLRPWRLLASGAGACLLAPLLVLVAAVPLLWWGIAPTTSPMLKLAGAQLALLALGWPLAVLLYAGVAAAGLLLGSTADVVGAAVWYGFVPVTLSLAAGRLVRSVTNAHPAGYLLGRGLLVPFLATVAAGCMAHAMTGAFDRLGDAAVPSLVLVALIDAMLTAQAVLLLVVASPRSLATWSDRLYLRRPPPPALRAFTSSPAPSGAPR